MVERLKFDNMHKTLNNEDIFGQHLINLSVSNDIVYSNLFSVNGVANLTHSSDKDNNDKLQ